MPGHLVFYSMLGWTTPVLEPTRHSYHVKCYPTNHYRYFVVRKFLFSLSEQCVFIRWKLYMIVGRVISFNAFMCRSKGKYIQYEGLFS